MDKSYILLSQVSRKSWSDDSINGVRAPISKGHRLIIIIHVGREKDFVCNALAIWKGGQQHTSDYHDQMNMTYEYT